MSHIGFLLPPEHLALRLDRSSRSGNGFGSEYLFGFGSDSESHPFLHPDFGVYLPSYYGSGYEYFVEEIPYWERKRGQIALRFFYERDQGGAFDHRFLLRREKVE